MENAEIVNSVKSEFETVHELHKDEHSEGEMGDKMNNFMHSDTTIVILSLVVMITLGLVFRSLCNKLTNINQRKAKMRGGLKQMAESMNYVTRAMSNDLEIPNCPKKVMRTYSNQNRRQGDVFTNNMRKQAINNNLSKEEKEELQRQMGLAQSISIQIPTLKDGGI